MCKILTEPSLAKIRRFGNILNWEMLTEFIKVWVVYKKNPGYFVKKKKKKKNAHKLLKKLYYKSGLIYGTVD